MGIELLALAMVAAGLFLVPGLRGASGHRIRWVFLTGLALSLGGCMGALGWLGAETSGRSSFFNDVNPMIWVSAFLVGIALALASSIAAAALRARQRNESTNT